MSKLFYFVTDSRDKLYLLLGLDEFTFWDLNLYKYELVQQYQKSRARWVRWESESLHGPGKFSIVLICHHIIFVETLAAWYFSVLVYTRNFIKLYHLLKYRAALKIWLFNSIIYIMKSFGIWVRILCVGSWFAGLGDNILWVADVVL